MNAAYYVGGGITALVALYGYLWAEYSYEVLDSSAGIDKKRKIPFQKIWEDLRLNLPGGTRLKIAHVQEWVKNNPNGTTFGKKKSWDNATVRDKNLFKECAEDYFEPPHVFWLPMSGFPLVGFILGVGIVWLL